MTRPIVIGIGNPLRGDDGIGARVVDMLGKLRPDIDTIAVHQLSPELAEDICRASMVLFIDASTELAPGTMERAAIEPVESGAANPTSHHCTPWLLAQIARRLYGCASPMYLLAVGAIEFGFGQGLSNAVERAIPGIIDAALEVIREYDIRTLTI